MATNRTQPLLAIFSYSPGQQVKAREALDAVLAIAVFEQSLSLLFCGDGVWQLVAGQGDYTGKDKSLTSSLQALPLYDIHAVFADEQSLRERGLCQNDLLPIAEVIDSSHAAQLMANCQGLLSF